MLHICICALGGDDLLDVCLASIAKYAGPNHATHVMYLPLDTTDPAEHGRTIDMWRGQMQRAGAISDTDAVVIMDPDVALLSHQWRRELDRVFFDENEGNVGIWGAGSREDWGKRVHASMMAIRGKLWNNNKWYFVPARGASEHWRDTGGQYCFGATLMGWDLAPLERGPDWHGVSAWWGLKGESIAHIRASLPVPLWAHLGGGTHSDVTRMTAWQRVRRWHQVRQRQQFIAAVTEHLCS